MRYITLILLVIIFSCSKTKKNEGKIYVQQTHWVDSIYNSMTLQEKVGQLFMIATNVDKSEEIQIQNALLKMHFLKLKS